MLNLIIGIIMGVVGSSIAWFFVWKNNKLKFNKALEDAANLKGKVTATSDAFKK